MINIDLEWSGVTWEKISPLELTHAVTADTKYPYDIYLSGQMTGIPYFNYPLFNFVAENLRNAGVRVFNPAESFNGDSGKSREVYLRKDVPKVVECGAILLLDEWYKSEGAKLEFHVAVQCGLDLYRVNTTNLQYFKLCNV